MTKTEALHSYWNSFNMAAYPANAVPDTVELPYLTYTKGMSPEGYSTTVHLYYHTESEAIPDAKAEEICKALRNGGRQIRCEGGALWITLEEPEWFATDSEDQSMKHRIINVLVRDHTAQ